MISDNDIHMRVGQTGISGMSYQGVDPFAANNKWSKKVPATSATWYAVVVGYTLGAVEGRRRHQKKDVEDALEEAEEQ